MSGSCLIPTRDSRGLGVFRRRKIDRPGHKKRCLSLEEATFWCRLARFLL